MKRLITRNAILPTACLAACSLLTPLKSYFAESQNNNEQKASPQSSVRIAVIGSGIGGSAAAYYAKQELSAVGRTDVDIVVFERSDNAGGRTARLDIGDGREYEIGASAIYVENKHFVDLMKRFGLSFGNVYDPSNTSGIWNGTKFVLSRHPDRNQLIDAIKIVAQFGLGPIRARSFVKELVEKFVHIYELQEQGATFAHPADLFGKLGLYDFTQSTLQDVLQQKGIKQRFLDVMLSPLVRVNYNQSPSQINSLAGCIALVPLIGDFVAVREGNSKIVENLLTHSGAELRSRHFVSRVRRDSATGKLLVAYKNFHKESDNYRKEQEEAFDYVVIAAPLSFAGIELEDVLDDRLKNAYRQSIGNRSDATNTINPFELPFRETFVTLVSAAHFHAQSFPFAFSNTAIDSSVESVKRVEYDAVVTTESSLSPITIVGRLEEPVSHQSLASLLTSYSRNRNTSNDTFRVWKIFSKQTISDETLDTLFEGRDQTIRHHWFAYPILSPRTIGETLPFVLSRRPSDTANRDSNTATATSDESDTDNDGDVYYVNAMEVYVSTMETELVAAKNIALMLRNAVLQQQQL